MLASLLPGLRQVRTPLAAGYLWLINLWLIFGEKMSSAPGGWLGNVLDLGNWLGKGAVLAAISFSAYLIGSLNIVSPTGFLFGILNLRLRISRGFSDVPEALWRALWDLRERQGGRYRLSDARIRNIVREAILQRHDLRTQLLIADKELYGEYDRLESEAEFRLNVAPPLITLFIIIGAQGDWLWLLGVIPVVMIFWQGANREFEALAVLIRAILVGKIKASQAPGIEPVT